MKDEKEKKDPPDDPNQEPPDWPLPPPDPDMPFKGDIVIPIQLPKYEGKKQVYEINVTIKVEPNTSR